MATWPDWLTEEFSNLTMQFEQSRLPHGLLVVGRQGDGASLFCDRLTQLLLCLSDQDKPCGECKACKLYISGYHPDFMVVEPEGKSQTIRVEAVREVIRKVTETAQQGGNKVILLKNAETMNVNAANALLKVLEEPTDRTFLVLQANQIAQMLPTIRSRCRLVQLPNPDHAQATAYLGGQELAHQPEVLLGMAGDRPLDALKISPEKVKTWFEIEQKFSQNQSFTELSQFLAKQELPEVLEQVMLWVDSALRYQNNPNLQLASVSEGLLKSLAAHNAVSLFQFRDYIIKRLMGIQRQANLNAQLMAEELAWQWLGLRGHQ